MPFDEVAPVLLHAEAVRQQNKPHVTGYAWRGAQGHAAPPSELSRLCAARAAALYNLE